MMKPAACAALAGPPLGEERARRTDQTVVVKRTHDRAAQCRQLRVKPYADAVDVVQMDDLWREGRDRLERSVDIEEVDYADVVAPLSKQAVQPADVRLSTTRLRGKRV